jgi:hypothetical protein
MANLVGWAHEKGLRESTEDAEQVRSILTAWRALRGWQSSATLSAC